MVLVGYHRPQNIGPIVRAALKCEFVHRILVQNNNPDIDIMKWVADNDPRLVIKNSKIRKWSGSRWDLARTVDDPFYLAVDDDVFLFPGQIAQLFRHLIEDPSVPHGVHGILWPHTPQQSESGKTMRRAREESTVDVLHQLYAVTNRHVRRQSELLSQIHARSKQAGTTASRIGDDIVISRCGPGRARIHNVGYVPVCQTSHYDDIAISRMDCFQEDRQHLVETIHYILGESDLRTCPS